MATVYSLIAWGGRTGKTVSLSASTDVVTLTNHGLRNGTKLWPSGTLPSELNTSTPVYARSTASNTFTLHTSAAGAIANTGQILFAGSSTFAAVVLKSDLVASPASALAVYGLSDLSRWGASGSERIYDGIKSWSDVRKGISSFDTEFAEIGEPFADSVTATLNMLFLSGSAIVSTKLNGIRSTGFHNGVPGGGYWVSTSSQIALDTPDSGWDGIEVKGTGTGTYLNVSAAASNSFATRCIVSGTGTTSGTGLFTSAIPSRLEWNLVFNCANGIRFNSQLFGSYLANNTVVKNGFGIYTAGNTSNMRGTVVNNIVVGNTTNWAPTVAVLTYATDNVGESTGNVPWVTSGGSQITVDANWNSSTPLFMDYAGNDFRPYASGGTLNANSTLIVDGGTDYYHRTGFDIKDGEVPSYNNGGSEGIDAGCYEHDRGYGPHPASHVLTLDNVVVGSRVFVRDQGDTVTHYDQIAAASTVVITATVYGDSRDQWRIKVRKASLRNADDRNTGQFFDLRVTNS